MPRGAGYGHDLLLQSHGESLASPDGGYVTFHGNQRCLRLHQRALAGRLRTNHMHSQNQNRGGACTTQRKGCGVSSASRHWTGTGKPRSDVRPGPAPWPTCSRLVQLVTPVEQLTAPWRGQRARQPGPCGDSGLFAGGQGDSLLAQYVISRRLDPVQQPGVNGAKDCRTCPAAP